MPHARLPRPLGGPVLGISSGALLSAAGAGVVAVLLHSAGVVGAPVWVQVVGWPLAWLIRCEPVQRAIGGGRLDNRSVLRVLIGGTVFASVVVPTGPLFLFPLCVVLVATVHMQWSGARTWVHSAAVAVVYTVALQGAVHRGWLAQPLPVALSDIAAAFALAIAVATIANTAVLTAAREAGAAALDAERAERDAQLLHAATHDGLTGALNRTALAEELSAAVSDAAPGRAVAVVHLDIDGFKAVNDTHGHQAGDVLLKSVVLRLRAVLPPGEHLARVGGDEFVAVLRALPQAATAHAVATRAGSVLDLPYDLDGVPTQISASIGTVVTEDPTASPLELLRHADTAMYAAKRARTERAAAAHRFAAAGG